MRHSFEVQQGCCFRNRCALLGAGLCLFLAVGGSVLADPVPDYNLAVQFYKQKQFDRAAEACADFLKNYPEHELARNARLYWGQALVQQQKFADARTQFQAFLNTEGDHPDKPLAVYRLGECSYFVNDFAAARDQFTSYLKAYPEHSLAEWAWVYLGDCQYRLKAYPSSVKIYDAYLARFPEGQLREEAQFGLAKAEDAAGNRQRAQELFLAIAGKPGGNRAGDAQFQLGASFFDDGQYAQAAEAFDLLVSRFPQHKNASLAALNAGYARFHLQDFPGAIAEFEKAATNPAQKATAQYWTGLSHKSAGDYAKASELLSRTYAEVGDQPLAEVILYQWADSELRAGNYPKARELFLSVQEKWPAGESGDDALYSAMDAAFLSNDYDGAKQLFDKFAAAYPQSPLLLVGEVLQARILMGQGDALVKSSGAKADSEALFRQAEQILKRVAQSSTIPQTSAFAKLQLARTYERLGDYSQALASVEGITATSAGVSTANAADALLIRGNALLQLKKFDEASQAFQDLLSAGVKEHEPAGVMSLAGLLVASAERGDWSRVDDFAARLLAADPQDTRYGSAACRAGDLAYAAQDFARSGKLFETVVRDFPMSDYYRVALSGLAHSKYDQKDYRAAALAFGTLVNEAGDDRVLKANATQMQGLSLRQDGKFAEALPVFETGYKDFALNSAQGTVHTPEQLEASLNAYQSAKWGARTAADLNQQDVAERLYEAAFRELKRHPVDKQVQLEKLIFEWANLSYKQGKYERSDEIFRLLVAERPNTPEADTARMALGESAYQAEKYNEARELFSQLATKPNTEPFVRERSLTQLIDIDAAQQRWDEVLKWSRELSAAFPGNEQEDYIAFRMGQAAVNQEDAQRAIASLEKLRLKLAPAGAARPNWWPDVWILLASAHLQEKNYPLLDETAEELRRLATGNEAAALLYKLDLVQGRSFEKRANFPEARQAYQRVVDSEASRGTVSAAEAQFHIAETYLKENNHDVAYKEYMKTVVGYEAPEYQAMALLQAAKCDKISRRWTGAEAALKDLIARFPDSKWVSDAQLELKSIEPYLTKTQPNPQ